MLLHKQQKCFRYAEYGRIKRSNWLFNFQKCYVFILTCVHPAVGAVNDLGFFNKVGVAYVAASDVNSCEVCKCKHKTDERVTTQYCIAFPSKINYTKFTYR